jgi:hypothetical protein
MTWAIVPRKTRISPSESNTTVSRREVKNFQILSVMEYRESTVL